MFIPFSLTARHARLAALALVLAGTGLTACKSYLDIDPVALTTTEATFSTVSGTKLALIGTYQMLTGDNSYGTRVTMYYPYDTDELISSAGSVDGGRRSIARYKALSTNTEITNPWNRLYQGVERANICIANIPTSVVYDTGAATDTAAMHRMYGEALALRAQFYYELIRNWGDVPAQFTPTQAGQDVLLPNSDRNVTLKRLIDDLAIAEKLLPWRSASGYSNSRFTKGAVKALRARIAMQRGGYSLQGTSFNRQSDYLDYYRIARQECLDIMNHRSEHTLTSSFQEVFKSINELRENANNELLLTIGMGGSSSASDSKLGYYNGPRLTSTTYGNGSGAVTVAPPYFYAFDSLDTRRDVTITTYVVTGATTYASTTLAAMTDGKFRRDWRLPLLATPVALNYLGYSWPVIRFADVELLFAEAENELSGPTTAAQQALLEVRTRAFGGNSARAAAGLNLASKANFFDALVNERYLEFGSEGIRKYDLLRWNLFSSKLADVKAKILNMQANGTVPYGPTQVLVPVPATQYFKATSTGITYARSLYRTTPATAPTGTTSVSWGATINATYVANTRPTGTSYSGVASTGTGLAAEYVAGTGKELLPIPQTTIDTDPNLKQNSGY
jgi:hypothetical protein